MERIIGRKITDRCTLKATKDHDNANKVVQDPKLAEQRLTKNGNKAYYYKHSKKWQRKHRSPFMRLSKEVKLNIFKQACEGVTMIDKTRAPTGDFRRKFGLQNLAFVCKSFKAVFEEAFFELCTFKLHHYRLHPKHHHRNPMKTLHRIQNLQILWEPRSRSKITTSQLSVDTVMSLEKLRVITIDLVALPVERVGLSNGNIELHENILRNFNGRIGALPKWARDLMINSGKVSVLLQYYFTATTTELMGLTANDQQIQCAVISCDNNVITKTEITADNFTQMREKRPRSQMPKVEGIEGYEKFGREVPVKLRKLQGVPESRQLVESGSHWTTVKAL